MEEAMITTQITESMREWLDDVILAVGVEYARVQDLPDFQAWYEKQSAPWDLDDCVWKWLETFQPALPAMPDPPAWLESVSVTRGGYNEISLWIDGPEHHEGDFSARLQRILLVNTTPGDEPLTDMPPVVVSTNNGGKDLETLSIEDAQSLSRLLARVIDA
tara:strand:+ start:19880 stop:20362 length:483 start_codon:yes stop_codon:yes gene_type:complete